MPSSLLTGIVAYYKLEDTADSVGTFTLTNNNTVTFVAAKIANGASGTSTNSSKSLTVNNDLGITGGNCSISFWVKILAEPTSTDYQMVSTGDSGTWVGNQVRYDYNGGTYRLEYCRFRQNVANDSSYYTVTLGTTNWNHIVYTYDGTNIRGYLNNVLVAGPTASSGNGGGLQVDKTLILAGNRNDGDAPVGFTSGIIDECGFWTKALSVAEISELYNSGAGNQYPFPQAGGTVDDGIFFAHNF